MSFGVGASDVLAGIKIAVKIYEYGFAEENSAGDITPHPESPFNVNKLTLIQMFDTVTSEMKYSTFVFC